MIKLQESDRNQLAQLDIRICFSPFCFTPKNRIFKIQPFDSASSQTGYRPYLHDKDQCSKWTTTLNDLQKPLTSYKLKQLSNIQLEFSSDPITTLRKIVRLEKSDWKKQLNKEVNTIKKEIIAGIDAMSANVETKVQQIMAKKEFYDQMIGIVQQGIIQDLLKSKNKITETASSKVHQKLSDDLNNFFMKNNSVLSQFNSINFLKKNDIKKEISEIKNHLQVLQTKILHEKISQAKVKNQDRIQFYEWMFPHSSQVQENPFGKVQVIGSILQYKRQINFSLQGEFMKLDCILCDKYVIERIKNGGNSAQKLLKKFIAEQLIIHMYNHHHDRLFFSYLKNISTKNVPKQLSKKQFLELLDSNQYSQVHFIDRQAGVQYTENFSSNQVLVVEFISKKTKSNFKAKFNFLCIDSTRQGLNSWVSTLAFIASEQKGKQVKIISKRFDHIEEVSQILQLQNTIKCLKSYDGLEWVSAKQEQEKYNQHQYQDKTTLLSYSKDED